VAKFQKTKLVCALNFLKFCPDCTLDIWLDWFAKHGKTSLGIDLQNLQMAKHHRGLLGIDALAVIWSEFRFLSCNHFFKNYPEDLWKEKWQVFPNIDVEVLGFPKHCEISDSLWPVVNSHTEIQKEQEKSIALKDNYPLMFPFNDTDSATDPISMIGLWLGRLGWAKPDSPNSSDCARHRWYIQLWPVSERFKCAARRDFWMGSRLLDLFSSPSLVFHFCLWLVFF